MSVSVTFSITMSVATRLRIRTVLHRDLMLSSMLNTVSDHCIWLRCYGLIKLNNDVKQSATINLYKFLKKDQKDELEKLLAEHWHCQMCKQPTFNFFNANFNFSVLNCKFNCNFVPNQHPVFTRPCRNQKHLKQLVTAVLMQWQTKKK